jgi:hypothetical protein
MPWNGSTPLYKFRGVLIVNVIAFAPIKPDVTSWANPVNKKCFGMVQALYKCRGVLTVAFIGFFIVIVTVF